MSTGGKDEYEKRGNLLDGPPVVITIGLERFATDMNAAGVETVHVVWQPPARGNAHLARLLAKLG